LMSYDTFFVDQERTSKCDRITSERPKTSFSVEGIFTSQNAIVQRDGLSSICQDRVSHTFDTTFIFWSHQPSKVSLFSISRATQNYGISLFELSQFSLESVKLSWANKSKILWIEEK